jgi:hypothetical protein
MGDRVLLGVARENLIGSTFLSEYIPHSFAVDFRSGTKCTKSGGAFPLFPILLFLGALREL